MGDDGMSDLVERLRKGYLHGYPASKLECEAAARIEQLERELAETTHWRDRYHSQLEEAIKSMNDWSDTATDLSAELAAERALADQLGTLMDKPNQSRAGMYHYRWLRVDEAVTAYRKARWL